MADRRQRDMADEEQPAAMLFVPNERSTISAGTRLQATDAGRLSTSSYLPWAGDSVNDEPIADEDANRLLREALLDDTSSSNIESMLGKTIVTAMQAAVVLAEIGPNVMIMCSTVSSSRLWVLLYG